MPEKNPLPQPEIVRVLALIDEFGHGGLDVTHVRYLVHEGFMVGGSRELTRAGRSTLELGKHVGMHEEEYIVLFTNGSRVVHIGRPWKTSPLCFRPSPRHVDSDYLNPDNERDIRLSAKGHRPPRGDNRWCRKCSQKYVELRDHESIWRAMEQSLIGERMVSDTVASLVAR